MKFQLAILLIEFKYDQPINDQIKKYNEIRKIATGKGDDYTRMFLRLSILQKLLPINCS